VLGGLMLDNRAWEQIADRISEEDFYRKEHRLIFRSIASLEAADKPFDVVTLSEELEKTHELNDAGGLVYLGSPDAGTVHCSDEFYRAQIFQPKPRFYDLSRIPANLKRCHDRIIDAISEIGLVKLLKPRGYCRCK
jgi:hypothetical protein